jgi:hypothetical protein
MIMDSRDFTDEQFRAFSLHTAFGGQVSAIVAEQDVSQPAAKQLTPQPDSRVLIRDKALELVALEKLAASAFRSLE